MAEKTYEGEVDIPCPYCRGTGNIPAEGDSSTTCPYCGGDGYWNRGYISLPQLSDIPSPQSPVFRSHQIIEAIDIDEYNALTASQQASIQLFLSMGFIDLGESTKARAQFLALFGEGTNTRTALLALVS